MSNLSRITWTVALLVVSVGSWANSAKEKPYIKAQDIAAKTEQQQLLKAQEAAKQTQDREKQVLERQASGDWEAEQKAKANAQFNQRESREQRYLREAKEAAAKDRKIPKPN
ncbi:MULTISPECIES: hypothetical protein [Shewanella]|uniref:hypothetical protein n=1 Tax=Shewanella TaxID=22 RepID=UPI00048FCF50|nr:MULTISPECIES: hypothetical protein [Shewanella]QLE87354.1 hypothetical protein FLM48_21135 [Shewanella sp. Scap07]